MSPNREKATFFKHKIMHKEIKIGEKVDYNVYDSTIVDGVIRDIKKKRILVWTWKEYAVEYGLALFTGGQRFITCALSGFFTS